jgi:hypothetical protein
MGSNANHKWIWEMVDSVLYSVFILATILKFKIMSKLKTKLNKCSSLNH